MKKVVFALLVVTLAASPSWAAGLTLAIRDGKVSLDAQDVTIRQILTEWARVGKTRIVNVERVTSDPVTLKFDEVPEDRALDIILRAVPGYMAARRAAVIPDASMYDRILIMATTTVVAARPLAPGSQPLQALPFQSQPTVTRLRPPAPMNPGILPDSRVDDAPDMNDPAVVAAAAAGLIAVPGRTPGGVLDSTLRSLAASRAPAQTTPPASAPTPVWTAPAGAVRPGPPTPVPTPPSRPASIGPPQADR